MELLRFLQASALAGAAFGSSSCGLLLEAAVTSNLKSRAVPAGSTIEGRSFTVRVPQDAPLPLYVDRFDKKREILSLHDTDPVTRGYNYYVFPVDAAPEESAGTALLRYYRTILPSGHWEPMATRPAKVKGSIGQVDIRSRRDDGGFVLSSECFRDGNRIWIVSNLIFYPTAIDGNPASTDAAAKTGARSASKHAAAFARSFRLKRQPVSR